MIRVATIVDVPAVAGMMFLMYKELFPEHCSTDNSVFIKEVIKHYVSDTDTVYVDSDHRGFFIVRNETEPMAPTLERYNGIRVYIKPEHRKTNLLAQFYDRLFTDFPTGEILGITEIESEHIKVLDKRHTLIAKMYRLNRR